MILALVANASHRNWRDVVLDPQKGLKKRIEDIEQTNSQLRVARERTQLALDREQASRRTALAALQSQLDQLQLVLVRTESDASSLQSINTELSQSSRTSALELEKLTEETRKLREQIRSEQEDRDTLFAETLEMTDKTNQLRGFVQQLTQQNDNISKQVEDYKRVVEHKGIDMNEPLDGAPPERNGSVLVINRSLKLAEISIGFDEGLRDGHLLDVTRDGRYVGRIRVRKTEPDRAVAEILADFSEGIIQEGDRVDTTIE